MNPATLPMRASFRRRFGSMSIEELTQVRAIIDDLIARRSEAGQLAGTWLPIDTAAPLMGMSIGHLARFCRDNLAAAGQAKKMYRAQGGKPTWHLSPDALPKPQ